MLETIRTVIYIARHDPLSIIGFVLVGAFAAIFVHIQFKMREIGYRTYPLFARPRDWKLPAEYLRVRTEHGWSPWPVYLMWPILVAGIITLVIGLFRSGA